MVRSDKERRAKVSGAALDAFAPLTPDPKGASAEREVASSSFALRGSGPVLPASSLTIEGDAVLVAPPASPAPGEALEAKEVDSMGAFLAPQPPQTELGRKLWEIRRRIIESGARLLDWDQIEAEVAARRGEQA